MHLTIWCCTIRWQLSTYPTIKPFPKDTGQSLITHPPANMLLSSLFLLIPGIFAWEFRNDSARLINPISIIQFPNLPCKDNDGLTGECYTASECTGRGGTSTTSCANGLGVCCYIVQESCGTKSDVTLNNTYIRSPGYAGDSQCYLKRQHN